ncbi:MAG TPA: Hsp20/alpha crystallin family protein [Bryobacteraceae bacterium]|nr:Hsp20/alpha crystallin family protein [Bryobacteraceae bacterium]
MSIVRYSPFADFETSFPGLKAFEDTMTRLFAEPNSRPWVPPVDILENANELIVKADLPDLKLEDIDLRIENGTLTLKGERKFEKHSETGGYHRMERSYGKFERVFTLPETVDAEHVKADYKNGVLTVILPKKEIAKPRQVKIESNND